jgi:uracil-DNA glycosylase
MPLIHPRGSPSSRLWLLIDSPLSTDGEKQFMFSGGLGYAFQKMLQEAGLNINDLYIAARKPDTEQPDAFDAMLENLLAQNQPPLIFVMGQAASAFLPELVQWKDQRSGFTQLSKYVGSLLSSKRLGYPHHMMPLYPLDYLMSDWTERNVTTYIDLAKMGDELVYWKKHGTIQPLRSRTLLYHNMETEEIISYIEGRFSQARYLSEDIESVYPKRGSEFYKKHPGYPITLGIADSPDFGISFNLFRDTPEESRRLWRALDKLNSSAEIIGQNFFNFDALFISALGFSLNISRFHDTLIRHHILWPELSHKLAFLTRQYTRQPFYKDDGKQWSLKDMKGLRMYNCLDVCTTFEVFEGQEEEFKQKPHLAA